MDLYNIPHEKWLFTSIVGLRELFGSTKHVSRRTLVLKWDAEHDCVHWGRLTWVNSVEKCEACQSTVDVKVSWMQQEDPNGEFKLESSESQLCKKCFEDIRLRLNLTGHHVPRPDGRYTMLRQSSEMSLICQMHRQAIPP